MDVLRLLVSGLPNKTIAQKFHTSIGTVKTQKSKRGVIQYTPQLTCITSWFYPVLHLQKVDQGISLYA
jgi:hypothetical protein